MPELHPDHEAVRSTIANEPKLPDPAQQLHQLPSPHVHWIRRILIGFGGLIVILFLTFAVGYLRFSWQRGWLLLPARLIPFPVAIVGNHWISYAAYQQDVPNINDFLLRNQAPDAAVGRSIDQDTYTRKVILNKDIGETILDILAKKEGITVTAADVQTTYDAYVKQSGNATDVEQYIKTLYNWTVEQFKTKLIRPQVVQDKLAEKFYASAKDALNVLRTQLVNNPSTFGTIAETESDDSASASKGGQLDAMNTAKVQETYGDNAAAIEALKSNEISQVLETANGYELVQLVKVEAAKVKADGNVYTLRHILKQPDFNSWLSDQVTTLAKSTKVFVFEPRFRWEADCGILAKSEPSCTSTTNSNSNTNTAQ